MWGRLSAITVKGVRVEAFYHRYHCTAEPERIAGEILSRPEGVENIEEFFASLSWEESMHILEWQLRVKETLSVACKAHCSLNVHNSVLVSGRQRAALTALIADHSSPMTLEFTETFPMPAAAISNGFLRDIRDLGHTTALDDYGSGLNSLTLLTDFDFDIIKIDRSLVIGLDTSVEMQRELHRLAEVLAGLGKGHVIEGVETIEVFEILESAGFTTFQGFLFLQPIPVREMLDGL
jgi:EAL domain-containing protein (putative c-di-GMP-specific phosphodiesterase class I)